MEREPKRHGKIEKDKVLLARAGKGLIISLVVAMVIGTGSFFFTRKIANASIVTLVIFVIIELYFYVKERLKQRTRITKMEDVFPDFIELMASNLRAGMTIDRALLLSSRKEFDPLDKEILLLGKDIVTGQEITKALLAMTSRINSEKILKTVRIIISGIRSGGNLAVLLEETAVNMRERNFVEKKAASNVLMYLIFILFAVGIGAPSLFALSSVLVQVLTSILGNIPDIGAGATGLTLPFTLSTINISVTFIIYFSLAFLITIDILASLLLGLVNQGDEKMGLKYVIPLVATSLTVFFIVRLSILNYFSDLVG